MGLSWVGLGLGVCCDERGDRERYLSYVHAACTCLGLSLCVLNNRIRIMLGLDGIAFFVLLFLFPPSRDSMKGMLYSIYLSIHLSILLQFLLCPV